MRSMILICVFMFITISGLSYCGLWYMQSRSLRIAMEESFERINEKQQYVSYDAIETSGFPFDINVEIVNPSFNGRFDEFLTNTLGITHPLGPWEDHTALNGRMGWGLNLFSNHYHVTINGKWQVKTTVSGKTYQYQTALPANTRCDLTFANTAGIFDTLWDVHALAQRNRKQLLHDFRTLDCNAAAYHLVNAAGDSLMSGSPARFFINSETTGINAAHRNMRFYLSIKDSKSTPKGDELINAYLTALFPSSAAPAPYSLYGSNNADIDLTYKGPIEPIGVMGSTPIEVHLNQFAISNAAYQSQGQLHFTNGGDKQKRSMQLNVAFDSSYNETYDTLLHEMVRGFILQLYSPFIKQPADIQPLIRKYKAQDLYHIVAPAIPRMHSMGKLTQSLDFTYHGNPDMTEGEISFTNLNLSATPYGISGRGSIQMTAEQPLPAANILLTCANCNQLVDDTTDYTLRLQRTINTLSDEKTPVNLFSSPQSSGLKSFLTALAANNNADKNNYEYTILSGGNQGITINGKRLDEVLVLYSQTVAPALEPTKQPAIE
jgi:hypothetical protein